MAQRWMQAKDALARKHGSLSSGASRATGKVFDDLPRGRGAEPKPLAPKGYVAVKADSVQVFHRDILERHKARRAKRAERLAREGAEALSKITLAASSRVICK